MSVATTLIRWAIRGALDDVEARIRGAVSAVEANASARIGQLESRIRDLELRASAKGKES